MHNLSNTQRTSPASEIEPVQTKIYKFTPKTIYRATKIVVKLGLTTYCMYRQPLITGTTGIVAACAARWLTQTKMSANRLQLKNINFKKDIDILIKTDKNIRLIASIAFNFTLFGVVSILGLGYYLILHGKYISDKDYQTFTIPLVLALSVFAQYRDISRELSDYEQESAKLHLKYTLKLDGVKNVNIDQIWEQESKSIQKIQDYKEKMKMWLYKGAESQIKEKKGLLENENWQRDFCLSALVEEIQNKPFLWENDVEKNVPVSLQVHIAKIHEFRFSLIKDMSLESLLRTPEVVALATNMAKAYSEELEEIKSHFLKRYYLRNFHFFSYIKHQLSKTKETWEILKYQVPSDLSPLLPPSPTHLLEFSSHLRPQSGRSNFQRQMP